MNAPTQEQLDEIIFWLESITGHTFGRRFLALSALTPATGRCLYDSLTRQHLTDHDKLAWLGDSLLCTFATQACLREPSMGAASRRREGLTTNAALAKVAVTLQLHHRLIVPLRAEPGTAPFQKSSVLTSPQVLATAMEAILGAVFSDEAHERPTMKYDTTERAARMMGILPYTPPRS